MRVILAICLIRIQSNGDYPASSISDSPLGYAPVDKGKGGSNDLSLSLVIIRISLTVTATGKQFRGEPALKNDVECYLEKGPPEETKLVRPSKNGATYID